MGYYIIYDHALSNPRLATIKKPNFEGSTTIVDEAIYFKTQEEAENYLDANFYCQCAAIVKIVDTWSD